MSFYQKMLKKKYIFIIFLICDQIRNFVLIILYIAQSAASLKRGKTPANECPGNDTEQSDWEVPEILELWGMQSIPSLPALSGPLSSWMVTPDKGPIYGLKRTKPWFLEFTVFCI